MPNRQLNQQDNFESVSQWLGTNLIVPNCLVPHSDTLPNNLTQKGIYFWFMHPDGYKALNQFVVLSLIKPTYTKVIEDVIYDLVYFI